MKKVSNVRISIVFSLALCLIIAQTPLAFAKSDLPDNSPPPGSTAAAEPPDSTALTTYDDDDSTDLPASSDFAATAAFGEDDFTYSSTEIIVTYKNSSYNSNLRSLSSEEVLAKNEEGNLIVSKSVPENSTVDEAIASALADPGAVAAQPNYIYTLLEDNTDSNADFNTQPTGTNYSSALATTNDPTLSASNPTYWWWLSSVKANQAWDIAKTEKKITVAIIDTGAAIYHEDLQANIDTQNAWDALFNQSLSASVASGDIDVTGDSNSGSHGSHVAGIIGAVANNGKGGAGISYNANTLPIRAFWDDPPGKSISNTETLIKAYDYLINIKSSGKLNNLRAVNLSFGYYPSSTSNYDAIFHSKIIEAQNIGILSVAAAGNTNSSTALYPSDWDEVLSVTAVGSDNMRWDLSDHGAAKDICAPGISINSTLRSGYGYKTGTSMSSPIVAGTAALLWSASPDLSVSEVKEILSSTAIDLGTAGKDEYYGYGLVDAHAALQKISAKPAPIEGYFNLRSGISSSLTIDIAAGSIADGAAATIYTNNKTAAQIFQLIYDKNDGCYIIKNPRSGKVLDVPSAQAKGGAKIWQYSQNGTNAQKWRLEKQADGSYLIISKLNESLCLDIPSASTSPGLQLQLYTKNYTPAQKWSLGTNLQTAIPAGTYTIASSKALGQVIDVAGGSIANGANIQMYSANATPAQKYSISFDSGIGMYRVVNVGSNKAMDVAGGSAYSGANVWQYTQNSTLAQRWYFEKTSNGMYKIYSATAGMALDASGGNTINGTNVQVYTPNGTAAQIWVLKAS